jgi:hypothetical protein
MKTKQRIARLEKRQLKRKRDGSEPMPVDVFRRFVDGKATIQEQRYWQSAIESMVAAAASPYETAATPQTDG